MNTKPLTIVTGGAGFIGSHLVDRLLANGARVLALDNLISGNLDNLSHLNQHPEFELRIQDVSKFIQVDEPVEAIYHLASPASPIDFDRFPIQVLKAGALGTHNALGLAKDKGASFLLASTSEVYGDPLVHPQPESYWGNVNPIGPRGVYDEAKRYAEALTSAYQSVHGMDTRIVRIFNTYGPRMRMDDGRVIPNFFRQALSGEPLSVFGDGSQTRCFTFVDDLITGIIQIMESGFHEPVNLGSDQEITILELATMIQEVTGVPIVTEFSSLPEDDPRRRRPDLTRAQELISWNPQVSLRLGLSITWANLQKPGMPNHQLANSVVEKQA